MKKKSLLFSLLAAMLALFVAGCGGGGEKKAEAPKPAANAGKLVIYTSMKENLIKPIIEGFAKANGLKTDDITYQVAGAGKLMAKIAAERQSNKILADVIWTSEVPDFYQMKKEGILEPYKPQALKDIINPFTDDYDGSFTAARLGTLGIAINTEKIKTPPTQWADLLKPEYNKGFGVADPALSGTSYMSVALLEKQFGWDFFKQLAANGARIGKGSGQVIDDTSSGELSASLAVDYITNSKIKKGAKLALVYPPEVLMVPSPVAIFKGNPHMDLAKKFVEHLLSKEAQQIVAKEGTLPVRSDVELPKLGLPTPKEAFERGIKVKYTEILPKKADTIKQFTEIIGKKK